jgi:hypothetical protein
VAVGTSELVLRGLAGQVAGVLRRHLAVAAVPAAILGAGADAVELLRHHVGAEIALGVLLAILFELYVGYAELIVAADRSAGPRPRVALMLRQGAGRTPALLAASLVAVTLPLAASALLVIPGLWLLTRWSLFAPAIVHERAAPMAALRRSAVLVHGAFWAVACSVTVSVLIEHAVIHGTAHTAEPVLGSLPLGLLVAAVATMLVSPPAAFTISIVYERLSARAGEGSCTPPPETQAGHLSERASAHEPQVR